MTQPLVKETKLPLTDGQQLLRMDGRTDTVMGDIKPKDYPSVCWTLAGNWYRRHDGEQMARGPVSGKVVTIREFYKEANLHRLRRGD